VRQLFSWRRPVLGFVGLLIAYFAFPVDFDASVGVVILSLLLTLGGLALIGWTMVVELEHLRRGETSRTTRALAMLLVLLVVFFSLAFYLLELASPGQIADLHTRTDALYFTLSTMATVGYGDVHAEGQAARALVTAVIAFDVVVVASLVRANTMRHSELDEDESESESEN
jgi:voltage-gated potassium channel